ncbi:putative repeat protein (TIGR01451 family) [Sphingopyxis panaciterrae]|uniref:DUF11 domain-containing protein n=1 Tax=Sphingopyxis panaciterrae TaxID=363841 RepID=UPI0014214F49|nr:DUF11 domain-containing protein [Sphingopyxis panaciterrae]NIJ37029.1 putative repeat protein (TIGR01451 family) [Sphingopyxis panaciterrae]
MTSKLTYMGTIGLAAFSCVAAAPAFAAAGTTAGTQIINTATVNYQVGGIAQGSQNASNTIMVDRRVELLVEEDGTTTTEVSPGQTNAVTTFRLTNKTNEILDFALTASQISGIAAAHGGTDSFDVTNVRIYRDNPAGAGVGTYDASDTLVAYADEVGIDASIRLFVVADIPAGLGTNAVAGVRLTATAAEGGTAGSPGALVTQTAGANTAGKDTVFADAAGVTDAARDGSHSDDDDYTVKTATLTVTKSSRVVSDLVNGTSNPKMIPGAVIEYCIAVANATGGVAATSVAITDSVPTQLTFVPSTIKLNGTVTGTTCDFNGTAGGSYAAPVVSGTLPTINPGQTLTLVFQATVN